MSRYKGSTRAYPKARAQILAYANRCYLCGQPPCWDDPLVVDHIVPSALGGGDHAGNLAPAHRSCNALKADKPLPQIRSRNW